MKLKNEFESFYAANFGSIELHSPIFYNFLIGIRFQIGSDDRFDIGLSPLERNEKNVVYTNYIEQAVFRAISVFDKLFDMDDRVYIVVNSFEDDQVDIADNDISAIRPLIKNISDEYTYNFISSDDDFSCKRYVLQTKIKSIEISKLLERIIRSDMEGIYNLSAGTHIFNERTGVLYHLYDDRGLDVVANETQKLFEIYNKYNDWILDYDREKIEKIFAI